MVLATQRLHRRGWHNLIRTASILVHDRPLVEMASDFRSWRCVSQSATRSHCVVCLLWLRMANCTFWPPQRDCPCSVTRSGTERWSSQQIDRRSDRQIRWPAKKDEQFWLAQSLDIAWKYDQGKLPCCGRSPSRCLLNSNKEAGPREFL